MFFDRVYLRSVYNIHHADISNAQQFFFKSFHQIVRKTCFRTAGANPSYFGQTSLWWQMLPLKDGELIEECLRTQSMWSLQETRAICLLLNTVIPTVQMLTDSFINMHFFYRQYGLKAFLVSGDHLIFSIHHWTISMTWYLPVSLNSGQMLFHFFQQEVERWNAPFHISHC